MTWLTTRSAIREGQPDWALIAAYEDPVRRHLRRRFPDLPEAEREDLLQEVLLAMRERIVPAYRADAGRFRSFLVAAIGNRVRDHLRRRRPGAGVDPDALAADPSEEEADAIDLEALLVRAAQALHDRCAQASPPDLELVYLLSGVLVDGLSNQALARREGLSVDQVKRRLQEARSALLEHVMTALLPPGAPPAQIARAADLARACLRAPRRGSRALTDEPDAAAREAAAGFVRRLRAAGGRGGAAQGEVDLLGGLEAVLRA
ncbi:MAG: sigma-70 family RNA polymerase sigma factor [Planctomycetes bacterium]|nr:sigma-70 family RNA polymerase sigma factor [Planctomycetota bacterium]